MADRIVPAGRLRDSADKPPVSATDNDGAMDNIRIGRACRALRRRRGWRQSDLGARVGCHQSTISRLERGQLGHLSMDLIRRVFAALEARFEGVVTWRGGQLDRLLDERHASIVETAARLLPADGWQHQVEVTFASFGERGSIDLLAVHHATRTVAVLEVKSDIASIEETHRRHDVKVRLARTIVRERFGWDPASVGRILVLPEDRTLRRIVARHEATFGASYPARNREVRAWLKNPQGSIAGLLFVTPMPARHRRRAGGGPQRIRSRAPGAAA